MIGEAPHGSPYKFHGSTTGIDLKDFTIGHGSPFRMFDKTPLYLLMKQIRLYDL